MRSRSAIYMLGMSLALLSCAPALAAAGQGATPGNTAAQAAAATAAAAAQTGMPNTANAAPQNARTGDGNFFNGFVGGGGFATGGFDSTRRWVPPARVQQAGPLELVRFRPVLQPTFMAVRDIQVNGHVNRVSAPIVQEYFLTAAEQQAQAAALRQQQSFARVIPKDHVLEAARADKLRKQKTFSRVIEQQLLLRGGVTAGPGNGAPMQTPIIGSGPPLNMPDRMVMVPSGSGENLIGPDGNLLGKKAPTGTMLVPTAIGPAVIGSRGEFRGTFESVSRGIGRGVPLVSEGPAPLYDATRGVTAMRTLYAPGERVATTPVNTTPLGSGGYAITVGMQPPVSYARVIPNAPIKKKPVSRSVKKKAAARKKS